MMITRTSTYVTCAACGETDADLTYYHLLRTWLGHTDHAFDYVSRHEKRTALHNPRSHADLHRSIKTILQRATNLLLLIEPTTKDDTDWLPFELTVALDTCHLPVIAAYPGYGPILTPVALAYLWPAALQLRITNGTACVVHVPFQPAPVMDAVLQLDAQSNLNQGGFGCYSQEAYQHWNLL